MCFLGCKFTLNALAAGAQPRTPLGELKRSPRSPSRFKGAASRQGKGKGGERRRRRGGEREIGVLGREKGGREGKRGGRKRGRKRQREGGGVCVIGVGGIDAPASSSSSSSIRLLLLTSECCLYRCFQLSLQ